MSDKQQANDQHDASPRKGLVSLIIAGVLIVILVVVVVLWTTGSEPDEPQRRSVPAPEVTEPEPEPEPVPDPEPVPEVIVPDVQPLVPDVVDEADPEPEIELPELGESTAVIVDEAQQRDLNTRPVRSEHLVRDLVVFLHNLSDGEIIRESATVAPPDARFSTQTVDDQLYIDERTYARYNEMVDWFVGLESETLVRLYRDFEPLFAQAFGEIAHPDEAFEDQVIEAIDVLLGTPEPDGLLALSDDQVMYTFADPELEALPAAQKQMLRLGLDNQRRVKRKLREIRALLLES